MSRYWRNSAITSVALFLEACALYLAFVTVSALIQVPETRLPFWLVFIALVWGFFLSYYVLTVKITPRLRGLLGLIIGAPSLLVLAAFNTGEGFLPMDVLASGDLNTTVGFIGSLIFLVVVWWRAAEVSREDASLESVRSAFLIGLAFLFVAALMDSLQSEKLVSGFLVVGFFAVGLAGLALARFSFEGGDNQQMSIDWLMPIAVTVGAVLVLGLLVSAAGLGGLDDVTREVLSTIRTVGFWILTPVLLLIGLIVELMVTIGNWLSSRFGGGDVTTLLEAQQGLAAFQDELREEAENTESPSTLLAALKWAAFTLGAAAAGWVVYRLFRARRLVGRSQEVEETRESLFSWKRANDDMAGFLGAWWANLISPKDRSERARKDPRDPREFYHALLGLAERVGQPRKDWETPREHQLALIGLLPADPVASIVEGFQAYHYGHSELDEPEIERLNQDWLDLNEFLRQKESKP